jgi:glycosyltransferase involved in cell wall biosynthesis
MRKILLLIDTSSFGGIEKHVATLANVLSDKGHDVTVYIYQNHNNNNPLYQQLNDQVNLVISDGEVYTLRKFIVDNKFNIVHSHGYKMNIIARLMRLSLLRLSLAHKIKYVATVHNGDIGKGRVLLYTLLNSVSASLDHVTLVASHGIKRRFFKAKYMPNFIETSSLNQQAIALTKRNYEINFVGRLEHVKGVDRVLELAKILPDKQIHLWGSGSMLAQLEKQKSPSNIVVHGYQEQVPYHEMRFIFMPSRSEGLPYTLLEAMLNKCVVVAYGVGDIPYVISDNHNGFIVDGVDKMHHIVNSFSATNLARLTRHAKETVINDYSASSAINKLEKIYC